jgi:signal transduction histidine kinase/ActR/RegA family two-component response regulator
MEMVGVPLGLTVVTAWAGLAAAVLVLLAAAFWSAGPDSGTGPAPAVGDPVPSPASAAARVADLEALVAELTRARDEALEAGQRRDEFLATISHELRGPLNAILGWTQLLEPRPDVPDEVGNGLRVIRRNALRQRQLLDDLADVSRVVSGALQIEPQPMRVQDALDEACQAIRPDVERKGVALALAAPTPLLVSGDPRRLQQVLRNLLANAVRYTPTGGTVTVTTALVGRDASIAISDTGAGIEPAFLPHVFEAFRQQGGAVARDDSTFGLGLALARIIVGAHGGRVTAHSDGPGRGARFVVTLPALSAEDDTRVAPASNPGTTTAAKPLTGLRVLAVDDEPDWRELLVHILGAAGADARIAASAAEAIQIFETDGWRPDVVLTDIAMPVTDGYGLLASIRGRGGAGRAVPAVAMTAHAGAQERARTARAGFAEHLSKPVAPHELIDAVRRVADQSTTRARGAGV